MLSTRRNKYAKVQRMRRTYLFVNKTANYFGKANCILAIMLCLICIPPFITHGDVLVTMVSMVLAILFLASIIIINDINFKIESNLFNYISETSNNNKFDALYLCIDLLNSPLQPSGDTKKEKNRRKLYDRATQRLFSLLGNMSATEFQSIDPHYKTILCSLLSCENGAFVLDLVKAICHIDSKGEAFPFVQVLAEARWSAADYPYVLRAAREALPVLQTRWDQATSPTVLLRASEMPVASAVTLLRAAEPAQSETAAEQLLRASNADIELQDGGLLPQQGEQAMPVPKANGYEASQSQTQSLHIGNDPHL